MEDFNKDDVVVMALFLVTKDVIIQCAEDLDIAEEDVSDELLLKVKNRVEKALADWRESAKDVIRDTIGHEMAKRDDDVCPLHLTCSAACPFMQIGGCRLPKRAERNKNGSQ